MSQHEQGMLCPFRLSGSRMRQRAVQLRRHGQVLDALTMVRRAAEQENTPDAWLALAVELRQLGCWETALPVLGRVLSTPGHAAGVWLEMARCLQALGQNSLARDCLYHQLQDDPWSPEGDAARRLLMETSSDEEKHEPHRAQPLIRSGMHDWSSGNRPRGERRLRRALKIVRDKERLLSTMGMLCMLEQDFPGAQRYLERALRLRPADSRTLTGLSTLFHQMGDVHQARRCLQQAAASCSSILAEDSFLTAAWAQDAWEELQAFLDMRMKQYPWRIPLLAAKAAMLYETDDVAGAQEIWRTVLAIDPDDRQSGAMMALSQHGERRLVIPGMLPMPERARQQAEMRALIERGEPLEKLLQHGSRSRQLIDWFVSSGEAVENRLALELLTAQDNPALIPYLRELVARPFLHMDARQWALIRLTELGCLDEMTMAVGDRYTAVQCQRISERRQRESWRMFLPMLLKETAHLRMSSAIVQYAAGVWRQMTPHQRQEAVGSGRYVWCKAMEILWLFSDGMPTLALTVMKRSPVSRRRISRVLRRLAARIGEMPIEEHPAGPEKEIHP